MANDPEWKRTVLLGAVLLPLLAGVFWFFQRDDRPRADTGQIVERTEREIDGRTASVAVPWGRLSLTVGMPVRELPSDDLEPAELRSPRGGSFVPVSGDLDLAKLIPLPRTVDAEVLAPEIALIADGKRYPVEGIIVVAAPVNLSPGRRTGYLAVDGTPKDLRLEVGYDGQRRIVDLDGGPGEPGRFAALDRVGTSYRARDCGAVIFPARYSIGKYSRARCKITWAQRMPYVAGLGWAPEGKAWLVVTQAGEPPAVVNWRAPSGEVAEYKVEKDRTVNRFALAGAPAAAVIAINDLPAPLAIKSMDDPQQGIFSVDAAGGPVTITFTQELRTDRSRDQFVDGAPDSPVVPVSWRIRVP